MNRLARATLTTFLAIAGTIIALSGTSVAATAAPAVSSVSAVLAPAGCEVSKNLATTANDYISKCRLASVRNEFPGEYYERTLAQIKVDRTTTGRKAWKLLTDSRFAKP